MYIQKLSSPLPSASLLEALELPSPLPKKPFSIAAVGSGGKTTLLYLLAREARERHLSVLLLPTTHMQLPKSDAVLSGRPEDAIDKLKKDGFAIAGIPVSPKKPPKQVLSSEVKKIGFPGWETYEKAGAFADLVLVEADGSRRLPLKYPNTAEPVIPTDTDLILCVTGLSALGKVPAEVCHRMELAEKVRQIASSERFQKSEDNRALSMERSNFPEPWTKVTASDLVLLQKTGYLQPLRQRFPSARVLPVWNQADTDALRQTALSALQSAGEPEGLITAYSAFCP